MHTKTIKELSTLLQTKKISAAELATLVDASGGQAQLARPDGGVVAAGAAADHDHVEIVSHGPVPERLIPGEI